MEYEWLEKVFATKKVEGAVNISWAAHHSSKKRSPNFDTSITLLSPLLRAPAHSVATVRYVMDRIKDTVTFLNPGQIPVIAADQPIYAVAKHIQWHWPDRYGEDKFVIMFFGLHIEMAALRSIWTLLKDSGWTGSLIEAGIASPGTAKTRQMRQITACSLCTFLKTAYIDYCSVWKTGVRNANIRALSFSSGIWYCQWN
jgi:hypothetical protein